MIESCASTQIKDSVSANLKVSLRSISILLKTYCFFLSKYITISIQIDDQSCVKKPSSTGNSCLRKVIERKVLWFDATCERAQLVPMVGIQKTRVEVSTRPLLLYTMDWVNVSRRRYGFGLQVFSCKEVTSFSFVDCYYA